MVLLGQFSVLALTDCPMADDIAQLDPVTEESELVRREKMKQELTKFQLQRRQARDRKKHFFFVIYSTEICETLLSTLASRSFSRLSW